MDAPSKDLKRGGFSRSQKIKQYWKRVMYKKKPEKQKQKPYDAKKANKIHDFTKLHQAKLKKLLSKRNKRQEERDFQRKTRTAEEMVHLSTCQALNRFERQCKTKVMDKSNFCKIHQYYDSASGLVQCIGMNKLLKQCIKSVPKAEQYCNYHRSKKKKKTV